jgi:hypothetical protein
LRTYIRNGGRGKSSSFFSHRTLLLVSFCIDLFRGISPEAVGPMVRFFFDAAKFRGVGE